MPANLNSNVSVTVTGDALPVSAAVFTTLLHVAAAGTLSGGFTERVRYYDTAADAAADVDLTSDAIDAVEDCFSQTLHVNRVGVARVGADVAQVHTVTITTAADGVWQIPITLFDGTTITAEFTASGSAADTAIATGLRAAITTALAVAHNATPSDLTPSGVGAAVIITADVAGNPFTVGTVVDPGAGTHTSTATTANKSIKTEMALVAEESSAWYGVTIASRVKLQIERMAEWVETTEKVFIPQNNDADLLTSATDDLASVLKAAGYKRTGLLYHATDGEWAAEDWAAFKLAADPDTTATLWSYATLTGPTKNTSLSTTEKTNLDTKRANYYLDFFGSGATAPGVMADGGKIEDRVMLDWVTARTREAVANRLLAASARNSKIPYTDVGIETMASAIRGVLVQGENAGHFVAGTASVIKPKLVDVSDADKTARVLRLSFRAQKAGAIEKAIVTGSVTVSI